MVRAGQNIMSQVFRRHIRSYKHQKQNLEDIIVAFADEVDEIYFKHKENLLPQEKDQNVSNRENYQKIGNFSIQEISRIAYYEYNYKPGQWYTPMMICDIMETIQ